MIKKVFFGAAIVLISAVATATPVGADPSLFSVLNCDCDGSSSFLHRGPSVQEQIDAGIENGMTDLLGPRD
ncbi:hypothetical protein [Mycobacterium sp. Z3061]|uniref:hypothetical protein n=1 Tax=Mycobacterium sp. Z3061 TaxID=3073562 RepID=UPI002873B486|nr:hypothetical protein [Mycobacterium sp. Z3061]